MAGQIILLIYAKTGSKTTAGLETVFEQDTFMGFQMDPVLVLGLSIAVTLKSCFTLHLKAIKTEKQFVPLGSSIFIFSWGLFSSLRRIVSMVCWFIPSLGLFSTLYHFKAEQIPFKIWRKYNKTQNDKIVLLGLNAMRSLYWLKNYIDVKNSYAGQRLSCLTLGFKAGRFRLVGVRY